MIKSHSAKRQKLTPDPEREQSSDSSESEQGSLHGLDYWEDQEKSSSEFELSEGALDESESDSSALNRSNIIQNHIDDISLSEGDLSASFHDDSSYESSVDDDLMPDLYDSSEESEDESALDSDDDEDGPTLWTDERMEKAPTGKFVSGKPAFPKFNSISPPGPLNIPPATSFPVDFFHLYFNLDIMKQFVVNTNIIGAQNFALKLKGPNGSHMTRWEPTSVAELYRFFGVILHMGIKRQPTLRSYWSLDTRYSDPFVKACFRRDRFENIKKALHVVNPTQYSVAQLKVKQRDDPFWRVTPLLEHLSEMFSRFFTCGQDIDIDEMCIGFKGRHIARCYNPNKPEKWHLKAFCLNDASSGYLHRFYMYQGLIFFFP